MRSHRNPEEIDENHLIEQGFGFLSELLDVSSIKDVEDESTLGHVFAFLFLQPPLPFGFLVFSASA